MKLEALLYAMENAVKGSFIVVCSDETKKSIEVVQTKQREQQQSSIAELQR